MPTPPPTVRSGSGWSSCWAVGGPAAPEVDELVTLYQRTATHLSVIRSSSPDPALVARLSALVARARSVVTGAPAPAWRDVARFFAVSGFPAALYRTRRWWVAVGGAVGRRWPG